MFSGLRNRWREARADVAEKEAADILSRYERLGGYERYVLSSAFDYTKTDLEIEHGEFAGWRSEDKFTIAKKLMQSARQAYRTTVDRDDMVIGACGLGLLSLYLEAQTLPGEHTNRLVSSIADWHRRAVEHDNVSYETNTRGTSRESPPAGGAVATGPRHRKLIETTSLLGAICYALGVSWRSPLAKNASVGADLRLAPAGYLGKAG